MSDRVTITGPYRITTEVAEFTGDDLGADGLPVPGASPSGTRRLVAWYEANGIEITDLSLIRHLETTLPAVPITRED